MPASSKYESRSVRTQKIDETEDTKVVRGVQTGQKFDRKRDATDSRWSDNRGTMGGVDRESHSESESEFHGRTEGNMAGERWGSETVAGSSMSSWKVTQPGTPVAKGGHNSPWRSETRTWWMSAPSSAGPAAPAQAPPWWADNWVTNTASWAWDGIADFGSAVYSRGSNFATAYFTFYIDLGTLAASPLIHAMGSSSSYWDNVGTFRNELSSFLVTNRESLIQIGIGVVDIGFGIALTGSAGGAPPGLLLIAVGADQVYAGINTILTGQKSRSLFEEAGYQMALKMGYSESTAGIVGQLTPGLLSLGAGIWGGLATSAARAGRSTSRVMGVFGPGDAFEVAQAERLAAIRGERIFSSLTEFRDGEKLTLLLHGHSTRLVLPSGRVSAQEFAEMIRQSGKMPSEIEFIVCNLARRNAFGPNFAESLGGLLPVRMTFYSDYTYLRFGIVDGLDTVRVCRAYEDILAKFLGRIWLGNGIHRKAILSSGHRTAIPTIYPGW